MQPRYTFTAFCQVMFLVIIVLQSPGQALASYPNAINDDSDQFQYVVSAPGLPGWRISEPFISLWLHDALIRYQTSHGRTVAFDLSYKQRDSRPASSVFGFGRYWECSWLSAIAYNYEPPQKLGDIGKVDGIFPYASLGGVRVYTLDDTTVEYSSKSTLLDQWGVNHEAQN